MPQQVSVLVKLTFSSVGLICIALSFLIGFKQKAELIAGYNPAKVTDKKGLCRWMGMWTAVVGVFTLFYPWLNNIKSSNALSWVVWYTIPILVIAVFMIIGSWRYEKK